MSESSVSTTVYPHQAVAILSILKVWTLTGAAITALILGRVYIPEEVRPFTNGLALLLFLGSLFFAIHQLLHYSHTYLKICKEAIIYRKGWIPSSTDNIFWINIKDINTSASVTESLLGTGTIIIIVAIRNAVYQIQIGYLPHHEKIAGEIRDHLSTLNQEARQVTYT